MPRKPSKARPEHKLFVLDTNVLLHDPQCLFKFGEHDILVPFVTLEELDNKKSGQNDVNRNARQATRFLDDIVSQEQGSMDLGYPLASFNGGHATGRLYVQRESLPFLENEHHHKNDNLYLSVLAHAQKEDTSRQVVLVTKDLNLRIKARALQFKAEDYRHDHAVEDADLIYRGWRVVEDATWQEWLQKSQDWQPRSRAQGPRPTFRAPVTGARVNEFLLPEGGASLYRVMAVDDQGWATLQEAVDTSKPKNQVFGIGSRNDEQMAAMNLLLDENIDMVALLGPAGTGKTLLALATALSQIKDGIYDNILFTRAQTPLGEEIGFLPGNEEEKTAPWMGAMFDNLEFIGDNFDSPVEAQKFREWVSEVVSVRAMTFMRGRTFQRKVIILDEAQNLTPKQMKALITRAGEGTKIIVLGNLAQIDSPYLSETSSGLAYVVERFKGWPHFGALVLEKGVRSRLANEGNQRL